MSDEKPITLSKHGKRMGRPPGTQTRIQKEKMRVLAELDKIIGKQAAALVRAALVPALGTVYIFRVDEVEGDRGKIIKKHVQVHDPKEMEKALDAMQNEKFGMSEGKYVYITSKEPDVKAIEMLLTRALGKPKETLDLNVQTPFSLMQLAKMREQNRQEELGESNEAPLALPVRVIDSTGPAE